MTDDETIPDSHDPLCYMAGRDPHEVYTFGIPCECEAIARVRADERRKVAEEIARAIETEQERLFRAHRRASLSQGLLTAATIARRIGGTS